MVEKQTVSYSIRRAEKKSEPGRRKKKKKKGTKTTHETGKQGQREDKGR